MFSPTLVGMTSNFEVLMMAFLKWLRIGPTYKFTFEIHSNSVTAKRTNLNLLYLLPNNNFTTEIFTVIANLDTEIFVFLQGVEANNIEYGNIEDRNIEFDVK